MTVTESGNAAQLLLPTAVRFYRKDFEEVCFLVIFNINDGHYDEVRTGSGSDRVMSAAKKLTAIQPVGEEPGHYRSRF